MDQFIQAHDFKEGIPSAESYRILRTFFLQYSILYSYELRLDQRRQFDRKSIRKI